MRRSFFGVLFSGLLSLSAATQAQSNSTPVIVSYGEHVSATGVGRRALYQHALAWSEKSFTYLPKMGVKTDAVAGTIRMRGTGTIKIVGSGNKELKTPVQFEFTFRATDNDYDYGVNSFLVIPDPAQPTVTVPLGEYVAQLAAERSNQRTFNDRRAQAQATALASEVALSFRSYMNSHGEEDDGVIGVD